MQTVRLQFETIVALNDFLSIIQNVNCEINRQRLTVICELSEAELNQALHTFGAKIIDEKRL